uniref:Uncharacterized protein n=1 Tax=Colobus angolensis palliatus TaxID=336983 RepID=A0A2K5IUK3_COLAP
MSKPHREAGTAFIQTQQLHHMCCLDIHTPPIMAWNTGIICTNIPRGDHQEHAHSHGNFCF